MMNTTQRVVLSALTGGALGWLLENLAYGPRFSQNLPGVPFLPIYAAGGAAVALLEPHVRSQSLLIQALVYTGALTALEAAAGLTERALGRAPSWDYNGAVIDVPHAALWGALGLLAASVLRRADERSSGT